MRGELELFVAQNKQRLKNYSLICEFLTPSERKVMTVSQHLDITQKECWDHLISVMYLLEIKIIKIQFLFKLSSTKSWQLSLLLRS